MHKLKCKSYLISDVNVEIQINDVTPISNSGATVS